MRSKVIEGYENYTIYEDGRVYNNKFNRFMKIQKYSSGRSYVTLRGKKGTKPKAFKTYRLMAQAFIPNPNNYPVVRHLNDDPTDDRLENLAWGTISMNNKDMYRNGYRNHNRKLTDEQVIEIFNDPRTCLEIAKDYPVGKTIVSRIKTKQAYEEIIKEL